jgi:hypothetical protein
MKDYLKIYKQLLEENAFNDLNTVLIVERAVKSNDLSTVYFISRSIYARSNDEKLKMRLTNFLVRNGFEKIVPFNYLLKINENAEFIYNIDSYDIKY